MQVNAVRVATLSGGKYGEWSFWPVMMIPFQPRPDPLPGRARADNSSSFTAQIEIVFIGCVMMKRKKIEPFTTLDCLFLQGDSRRIKLEECQSRSSLIIFCPRWLDQLWTPDLDSPIGSFRRCSCRAETVVGVSLGASSVSCCCSRCSLGASSVSCCCSRCPRCSRA